LAVLLALNFLSASAALAEEPSAPETADVASPDVSMAAGTRISNVGAGGALEFRLRTASELQFGVDVAAGRDWEAYLSGYAARDALRFELGASMLAPVWRRDDVTMSLGARGHLRHLADAASDSRFAPTASWAAGLDLALLLHAPIGERGMLRIGAVVPIGFELSPTFQMDNSGSGGALISLGGAVGISDHFAITLDVDAGGVFGADGDGMKFLARGTVALRYQPGARPWLRF
jgi:hypothetical protein